MTASKFKVGDRVIKYDTSEGKPCKGTVVGFTTDNLLKINMGVDGLSLLAHPKACRRLTKKPRRRVWIEPMWLNASLSTVLRCGDLVVMNKRDSGSDYVEFIEVKKRGG